MVKIDPLGRIAEAQRSDWQSRIRQGVRPRTSLDEKTLNCWPFRGFSCLRRFREVRGSVVLVAPQGFEPRSSESESLVLPLNEGATD
jgi:hypothetical protein